MIYVVRCRMKSFKRTSILYPGYSDNPTIAEKYKELKEEKSKDPNCKYDIILIPNDKFEDFRRRDPVLYLSSEINNLVDDIYVSDDDYEILEQSLSERVTDLQYHFRESIKTLKLFDDKEASELVKSLKKFMKRIEKDYDGEDFWSKINWKRAIDKIDL